MTNLKGNKSQILIYVDYQKFEDLQQTVNLGLMDYGLASLGNI